MILFEAPGDVFNCTAHTITCPINTVGTMGSGLALAFKNRVPGLFEFYRERYPDYVNYRERAHDLHTYRVPDGRQVLLFPTKLHWSEPSPLGLVEANLAKLALVYQDLGIQSLALPALGCGKGQLDYLRDVKPLVHRYLGPLPLQVQVLFR